MKKILVLGDLEKSANYFNAIRLSGAEPFTLDLAERKIDSKIADAISRADGIVFQGGVDVNPALYGEKNAASEGIDNDLDSLELAALKIAEEKKKPVLGICRGLQIMNVFFGGSLIQHIPCAALHARDKGSEADKIHATTVHPSSFINRIYRSEKITVNSAHHQAVKILGAGLSAVQFSDEGIIEAFQHEELPFFAVQWHPERLSGEFQRKDAVDGLLVFRDFLKVCHSELVSESA